MHHHHHLPLRLLTAALAGLPLTLTLSAQTVWRHTLEHEDSTPGIFGSQIVETRLGYYDDARLKYRVEDNLGYVVDSLVYRYDERGNVDYRADYRGPSATDLTFYTYDEWEYDPWIAGLAVWHVGHQYVDQQWSIYAADKTAIVRDDEGQIVRIGDYTPGNADAGEPDVPLSYVKTFGHVGGRLATYRRESYNIDPVTEEAYLHTDEEWSDMEWAEYAGQVTDPNTCMAGHNRISRARVYDAYYGYTYDLSVSYTPALTPGAYDFTATHDAPEAAQRKVHTLEFTDANGSFSETFRTYRLGADGSYVLAFVERVTETYDDHHNITLQERALTARTDDPESLSVRQGKRWEYTYDPLYNDWTRRRELLFTQSYDEGVDGTYDPIVTIIRSQWVSFDLTEDPDAIGSITVDSESREDGTGCKHHGEGCEHGEGSKHSEGSKHGEGSTARGRYNLQGQPTGPAARGLGIEHGRKVLTL